MAAYTADDLARVRAAIARGELRVDYADRSVTYRTIDELMKAEAHIAQAISPTRAKQSFGVARKGL